MEFYTSNQNVAPVCSKCGRDLAIELEDQEVLLIHPCIHEIEENTRAFEAAVMSMINKLDSILSNVENNDAKNQISFSS